MESEFSVTCRQLANILNKLADEYDKDNAFLRSRIDCLEYEIERNNKVKRKIFTALQEDLNGI